MSEYASVAWAPQDGVVLMAETDKPRSSPGNEDPKTAQPPSDLRRPAALVRTAFSSEQTLLSWIRTSLSLITFGFSITKFFYYLGESQEGAQLSAGPRRMGIALVCVGLFVLVLAIVEYVQRLRRIREQGLPKEIRSVLPISSAVAMLVIGIVALASIVLSWPP